MSKNCFFNIFIFIIINITLYLQMLLSRLLMVHLHGTEKMKIQK